MFFVLGKGRGFGVGFDPVASSLDSICYFKIYPEFTSFFPLFIYVMLLSQLANIPTETSGNPYIEPSLSPSSKCLEQIKNKILPQRYYPTSLFGKGALYSSIILYKWILL